MALWFLICSVIQKGIGTISTPIFTRIMTDEQFGAYNVYTSWQSIITIVVTLNISGNCITRELVALNDEKKKSELSSSLYGLTVLLVGFYGIIYFIFRDYFNKVTGLSEYLFLMMGCSMLLGNAFNVWMNQKRVEYKYWPIVIVTLLFSIIRPVLAIIFVLNSPESSQVEARVTGANIGNLIAFSWIIVYLFVKGKVFFNASNWKYAITFCIPLIPHYLSRTILNESDRLMISHYIGDAEVGYYSIAYTIASIMLLFNTSVAQSLDPWIYQSIKNKNTSSIGKTSYLVLIIIALINLCVMSLAPELLRILAPPSYYDALWVIPPVTASVFFTFMYDLFASFQFYFKKTTFIALASCGGAVCNIILNIIFIPMFGYIAAGYTTLVCYIIFGILHYLFMRWICRQYMDNQKVYDWRIVFGIGLVLVLGSLAMVYLYKHSILRIAVLVSIGLSFIVYREKILSLYRTLRKKS